MWSPHEWTAFGTVALAAVTLGLIFVGLNQIKMLRDQNRRWHTLGVCERFNTDPLLDRCLRALRQARESGDLEANPKTYTIDAMTVLNYLDGVAIGIYQGLYVDKLARDHLQVPVEKYVQAYLTNGAPGKFGLNTQSYRFLMALAARWTALSRPHFSETDGAQNDEP